jgi:hypothetical protein
MRRKTAVEAHVARRVITQACTQRLPTRGYWKSECGLLVNQHLTVFVTVPKGDGRWIHSVSQLDVPVVR